MTNSEQTPAHLGVTPENYEGLVEILGQESEFLEEACDLGDRAISPARAIALAVRAGPNDVESTPLNRGLEGGRIAREISESLDLSSRLGPTAFHGTQALLNRAGFSSEQLAIAHAAANRLHFAGGPAQFEGTTIRHVVRRQTQAWHDQGWTPRTITRGSSGAAVVGRPRARGARPTRARALARSSSRSGDSGGDSPGEPSPSDLAGPCCCERCGAELLAAACLCGLCKEEDERAKPHARVCAHPQCDAVLTGKGTQETCDGPDGPHKRWLSRGKRKLRERPERTSCEDCGRLWLSDVNPKLHPCPVCGGVVRLGRPTVPATMARYAVSPDPLSGVNVLVFQCLYGNRGLQGSPSPPDDVKSDAQNDTAAENNVVSIWSLPRDLPDYTVAGLLGLPMPAEIAVAA
jgi:hypothetical protein